MYRVRNLSVRYLEVYSYEGNLESKADYRSDRSGSVIRTINNVLQGG